METKTFISLGYWFSALSLGLLLHPYATLRRMVRDRLLRPLVVLPLVSAIFLWMVTFVVVRLGGASNSSFGIWSTGRDDDGDGIYFLVGGVVFGVVANGAGVFVCTFLRGTW